MRTYSKKRVLKFLNLRVFHLLPQSIENLENEQKMVRRRVEIKRIEDKAKRQTTFTKRRKGLFKKAEELGKKCDIHIAVITFSKAGNLFATGNPSVNAVINRYMDNKSSEDGQTNETNVGFRAETSSKNDSILQPVETEKKHSNEVEDTLEKIEEIKNKIMSMPDEDLELHGFSKTIAELAAMEDKIKGQDT